MANSSIALSSVKGLKPESLNKTIFDLALPAVLENILMTAVFLADTLLIGQLHDAAALAAIGLSNTYLWIANGLFMALGVGALALVARAYGAGDYAKAKQVAAQAIALSAVLSVLVMVVMIPLAEPFMRLLMQDPDPIARAEVVRQATVYIHLILCTAVLSYPLQVMSGAMRATGDTRTPMYITLIMNVINIFLAAALIFGIGPIPALKIEGAGAATALARALGGILALVVFLKGMTHLKINLRDMVTWRWPEVSRIWKLAFPNVVETIIQRVGFITFMGIVSSLGTATVAANQIANTVESLSFMPAFGLSVAATTLVGQSLGARNATIGELAVKRTAIFSLIAMSLTGLLFVLFGQQIASVFGATGDVLLLAGMAVQISALEQPSIALQMVYGGALRGAGDTRSPMMVSLIGVIFFRIAAVYLLAVVFKLGLAGVWLGTAIDWAGRTAVMYVMFRRGRWKQLKI
ncbi:MAG: MATE family efflux transporter [Chloroflexi bacterium]|nr:MATE family efflux transporter [Chloroflexota bacterium]